MKRTCPHTHTVFARSSCAPIKPRDLPLLILRQPRQQVLTERRSRKPSSCCHFVPLAEKSQDCHLGRSAVSSLQNIHRLFSDFPSRTPTPPTSWHHCVHFVIKEIKTSAGLTKCSRSLSPYQRQLENPDPLIPRLGPFCRPLPGGMRSSGSIQNL